jgi:glycosyltransferase involved in cell wall biosynthesis
MTKNPIISVIIPTYNCKKYIARAINSVFDQQIDNLEIIVIDDASTDNTFQYLTKKYQNKIKIIQHKTNQNLGAARNTGLSQAQGKYIFFLDSDDWLNPNAFKHILEIAEKEKLEITAFGVDKVWPNNKIEQYHNSALICNGGELAINRFNNYDIGSIVWNKLYLKSFLDKYKIKFITPYYHEDVMFTLQAIYKCKRYVSISDSYYNYFQHSNTILSGKKTILHLRSYFRLFIDISNFITINKIDKTPKQQTLSKNLIQSHCLNQIIPDIIHYRNSKKLVEWQNDLDTACALEISSHSLAFAQLINNIIKLYTT